jgi:hypothetical protein
MTNPDYTHLALIVDRSGSMQSIAVDMNGGIATLLDEQAKVPGEILVDAWTFDHRVEHVATSAKTSDPALRYLVSPRGMTALYDAIGIAVTALGTRLATLPEDERPGKVVVAVVTDGFENSSREWKADTVKTLVGEQATKYAWEFLYLGANDANIFDTAAGLGFGRGSTMSYAPSAGGTVALASAMSNYVTTTRGGAPAAFSDEDREAAADNS